MDIRKGRNLTDPFQWFLQAFKILLLGVIVLAIVFKINQIHFSDYFPIKTVRIYGANRVDHAELESILLPLVNKNFFNVNVEYIKERLEEIPWVSTIFVRRYWPDKVDITVVEKKPVARWNDSILSEAGELFSPKANTIPNQLPIFIGPNGKQVFMLQYFYEMNRVLTPLHAKISALEMTPYLTWKLTLNNGITLQIGHKDILTRLVHFVKVYPKIVGNRTSDVRYIDLRYPNGLAVKWRGTIKV